MDKRQRRKRRGILGFHINAENYLEQHPNTTLEDYLDYLADEAEKQQIQYEEEEKALQEYYESLVGKYWKIDFNGSSRIYFHMDQDMYKKNSYGGSNHYYRTYELYHGSDQDEKHIGINPSRCINELWFSKNRGNLGVRSVTEITKEEFEKITSYIESAIEITKEF